jgi:sarcosine oxidase subunit gamma
MIKKERVSMVDLNVTRRSAFEGLHAIGVAGKVSVAQSAFATRFSFRGDHEAAQRASKAFGVTLPLALLKAETNGTRTAISLGPDEWLLIAEDGVAQSLADEIAKALGTHFHSLVDISHRNTGFDVSGAEAATLLSTGNPLDLHISAFPVGMATRTIFSKAEIVIWRKSADTFHVEIWRSFLPFMWGLLEEASSEL